MSRSGYSDCLENWSLIRYRGQVASAIRGKRGQGFLKELVEALDALPEKKLVANHLECNDGVCAIGSIGLKRGIDLSQIDPDNSELVASTFDIAHQLARETVYENDEGCWNTETPEARWKRMRAWAQNQIVEPAKATKARQGGDEDSVHAGAVPARDLP